MAPLARVAAVALGALFALAVPQRQLVNASAKVTDGWWIRVLPTTTATGIEWRFGATPMGLTGTTTPKAHGDPQLPKSVRRSTLLHLQIRPTPRDALVSFCLFWNEHGAAMVEVTEPTDRLFNDSNRNSRCVPDGNAQSRLQLLAPVSRAHS